MTGVMNIIEDTGVKITLLQGQNVEVMLFLALVYTEIGIDCSTMLHLEKINFRNFLSRKIVVKIYLMSFRFWQEERKQHCHWTYHGQM